MWDLKNWVSRGYVSSRRIFLLVSSLVVAVFAVTTIFSAPVYAADVERASDGNSVKYGSNTYARINTTSFSSDPKTKDLPIVGSSFDGYQRIDGDTLHLIVTDGDATSATSGRAVSYTIKNGVYDASTQSEIKNVSIETGAAASNDEDTETCGSRDVDGIGWLVCPVVEFIARSVDKLYKLIDGFLNVSTVTNDTNSSIYTLWSLVRDVSNICFVIAFLFIVYSHVSGLGVSNYGIKNMLPRLIVAAILMNVSYWVCALAVDISNLLGQSIHSTFMGVMESHNTDAAYAGAGVPTWEVVTTYALSGAGVIAGTAIAVATGAIFELVPFLLGAILALVVAFLVLAARQALIVCLVIISPLAFVAYVLPNTEKYFEKWRESFTTLLLVFPIFSVIFSGAQLAGMAITQNAGGNLLNLVLGMAVQVVPLAITPLLIKISGGILNRFGGMINNPNKGLIDRSRNWAKERRDMRRNRVSANQNLNRLDRLNPANKLVQSMDKSRRSRASRTKSYDSLANSVYRDSNRGRRDSDLSGDAEIEDTRSTIGYLASYGGTQREITKRRLAAEKSNIENAIYASREGQAAEAATRAASIHKTEIDNAFDRRHPNLIARQQLAEIDKQNVNNEFGASTAGRQVDRARRMAETNKTRIDNLHQAAWDEAAVDNTGSNPANIEVKRAVLETKASEVKASRAKSTLEQMQAEIIAQGDRSEHVIELRGAAPTTQTHIMQIARDIKTDSLAATAVANAKAQAERQFVEGKAQAYEDNVITIKAPDGSFKTIVEYAGGIQGVVGQRSVVAQAKTERSKFIVDDAKNIEATLSYDISSNPQALFNLFQNAQTDAERVAYTSIMGKRGGPGANKLREMVRIMDQRLADGEITQSDLNDYKELVISQNSAVLGLGKDLEFYFTNAAYGSDEAHPDLAGRVKTFEEIANDVSTWGNLSADAFAGMNIVNQLHGLNILAHKSPEKYKSLIANLIRSPSAMAKLKDDVVAAISREVDDERWLTGRFNTPSKDELTEFERHVLNGDRITSFDERDGYDESAQYWKRKYDKLYEQTERRLRDARDRGVDYYNAPEHKPKDK